MVVQGHRVPFPVLLQQSAANGVAKKHQEFIFTEFRRPEVPRRSTTGWVPSWGLRGSTRPRPSPSLRWLPASFVFPVSRPHDPALCTGSRGCVPRVLVCLWVQRCFMSLVSALWAVDFEEQGKRVNGNDQ